MKYEGKDDFYKIIHVKKIIDYLTILFLLLIVLSTSQAICAEPDNPLNLLVLSIPIIYCYYVIDDLFIFHNASLQRKGTTTYLNGDKHTKFVRQTKVKVTTFAYSYSKGWDNSWESEMDEYINKKGYVFHDYGNKGVVVFFEKNNYFVFPHYVLKTV